MVTSMCRFLAGTAMLAAAATTAQGALIVTNGSFETWGAVEGSSEWRNLPAYTNDSGTNISNWGTNSGSSFQQFTIFDPAGDGGFFTNGAISVYGGGEKVLNMEHASPLFQNVGQVVVDEEVTLSFRLGRETGSDPYTGSVLVELVLGATNGVGGAVLTSNTYSPSSASAGSFTAPLTLTGLAATPGDLTIRFTSGGNSATTRVWLDTVSISSTVVPEPHTLALLGLGGLAVLHRRRRRA